VVVPNIPGLTAGRKATLARRTPAWAGRAAPDPGRICALPLPKLHPPAPHLSDQHLQAQSCSFSPQVWQKGDEVT